MKSVMKSFSNISPLVLHPYVYPLARRDARSRARKKCADRSENPCIPPRNMLYIMCHAGMMPRTGTQGRMQIMNTNVNEMPQTAPEGQQPAEDAFTLQDTKRRYFAPANLHEGVEYVAKVEAACAAKPDAVLIRNFDINKPFPDGYGVAVIPMARRAQKEGEEGNIVFGAAIAALPDPELVSQHEKGNTFIRDTVVDHFCAKIANAVRPREGGNEPNVPFTIEDFIENRRGQEGMKTWTELAPAFVSALRKKGIKFMQQPLLKQVLQSAGLASQIFPNMHQEQWENVLNAMIARAKEKGLDPGVLENWLQTRSEKTGAVVDEIDLSDFDQVVVE